MAVANETHKYLLVASLGIIWDQVSVLVNVAVSVFVLRLKLASGFVPVVGSAGGVEVAVLVYT